MNQSELDVLITNGGGALAGLLITLIGFRVIHHKPGESLRYDAWFKKWGWMFKIGGPIMLVGNLAFAVVRLSR